MTTPRYPANHPVRFVPRVKATGHTPKDLAQALNMGLERTLDLCYGIEVHGRHSTHAPEFIERANLVITQWEQLAGVQQGA